MLMFCGDFKDFGELNLTLGSVVPLAVFYKWAENLHLLQSHISSLKNLMP